MTLATSGTLLKSWGQLLVVAGLIFLQLSTSLSICKNYDQCFNICLQITGVNVKQHWALLIPVGSHSKQPCLIPHQMLLPTIPQLASHIFVPLGVCFISIEKTLHDLLVFDSTHCKLDCGVNRTSLLPQEMLPMCLNRSNQLRKWIGCYGKTCSILTFFFFAHWRSASPASRLVSVVSIKDKQIFSTRKRFRAAEGWQRLSLRTTLKSYSFN